MNSYTALRGTADVPILYCHSLFGENGRVKDNSAYRLRSVLQVVMRRFEPALLIVRALAEAGLLPAALIPPADVTLAETRRG